MDTQVRGKEEDKSPELRGESASNEEQKTDAVTVVAISKAQAESEGQSCGDAPTDDSKDTAAASTEAAAPTNQPKAKGKGKDAKSKEASAAAPAPAEDLKESEGQPRRAAPTEEMVKEYSKLYPKNKVFYVTSDRTVFLQHAKNDAENHQRTLGGGEVAEVDRID